MDKKMFRNDILEVVEESNKISKNCDEMFQERIGKVGFGNWHDLEDVLCAMYNKLAITYNILRLSIVLNEIKDLQDKDFKNIDPNIEKEYTEIKEEYVKEEK